METLLFIGFIFIAVLIFYTESKPDLVDEFVRKKKGRLISKERGPFVLNFLEDFRYSRHSINEYKEDVFYTIKYYDERNILHETILRINHCSNKVTVFQDKLVKDAS